MGTKSKILITLTLILAGLGAITIFQVRDLAQTRLVFCDVGQGDGILITSGTKQVVVDGGPGNKMVDCLGAKMPFWDRRVEMVVLTHPQQDHMEGLIGVLDRYEVKSIVTTKIQNNTDVFRQWQKAVREEAARAYVPDIGDRFVIDADSGLFPASSSQQGTTLFVLWPSREMINRWQENPPSDLNETSIAMRLDTDAGCAYLTGDIPKEILEGLIDRQCQILKISHHGSRTGTNAEILEKINPKVAVIQSGKNNRFGHPNREVLDLLYQRDVRTLRNDTDGTVEVTADFQQLIIDKSVGRRNN